MEVRLDISYNMGENFKKMLLGIELTTWTTLIIKQKIDQLCVF